MVLDLGVFTRESGQDNANAWVGSLLDAPLPDLG